MAGERKGLTRSGRKVVARYKNGFVNSNETSEVFRSACPHLFFVYWNLGQKYYSIYITLDHNMNSKIKLLCFYFPLCPVLGYEVGQLPYRASGGYQ